ncbi:hypothetical protein JRI60_45550 [Archangium violaceum]|uniref:hypothetical protein n=1 Tax=Archangium violaceum TaxID=83451 RepID=UPI00195294C3|nr:hypothetical protein [Archangium violaceum]QRN96211.1 hypothetical protein JRI60_45550 [Archangium violaceum]
MRRALLMGMGVLVGFLACRTTQPPGTENREPLDDAAQREEVQNVPAEPPGPAGPITEPDGGIPPQR